MDLEADVEAGEHERDELNRLRSRLEAAVGRATTMADEARRAAEAAAKAVVAPLQKDVASAAKRSELAELRAAVERVERRMAAMEERVEAAPLPEDRLDEVEQAVIELARRMGALREEFDYLVQGIGS